MRDPKTLKRRLRWAVLAGLAMSVLTACTVSVSGGILGALASMGVFALFALLVGGAQTGCVEDAPTPDDAGPGDARVGPCLTDAAIGPCLSADQSVPDEDAYIGPCLSADQSVPDEDAAIIGPCLGAPLDDRGPPDRGLDAGPPDLSIGPCLEPPPEPDQPPGKAMAPGIDHGALFAKVSAGLPPDIAARLVRPTDEV